MWPQRPFATGGGTLPVPMSGARQELASTAAQGMYRFDPRHRGRSPYLLPKHKPEVIWTVETSAPVTSSPTLSTSGLVLVGSHSGKLFAATAEGKPAWTFTAEDMIWSTPAIAADGTVYVGSDDDNLYALDGKTGKPYWKVRVGSCSQTVGIGPEATRCDVDAGPTIGPDGTLYTGGDGIYAINATGTLRWRFPTGGHVSSAPAVAADGTVIAGSQDNSIYALAPDGRKQWEFRARDDVESPVRT